MIISRTNILKTCDQAALLHVTVQSPINTGIGRLSLPRMARKARILPPEARALLGQGLAGAEKDHNLQLQHSDRRIGNPRDLPRPYSGVWTLVLSRTPYGPT